MIKFSKIHINYKLIIMNIIIIKKYNHKSIYDLKKNIHYKM